MKLNDYKKNIILITYTLLLAFVLINIKLIFGFCVHIFKIFSPLWIGIAMAFVLNVPMGIIEDNVLGSHDKKSRVLSIILSIMIILLLMIILFVWVIPDFIDSATYLLGQIPNLLTGLNNLLLEAFKNTELTEYLRNFTGSAQVSNVLSGIFSALVNNFSSVLSNLAAFLINFITGIIIAVYFLLEKENLIAMMKDFVKSIFPRKTVKKIDEVTSLANRSFHDFITYQCLECLILGIIMFIAFVIFHFPYALTIAFLTTITAIIPIFGATVACIIGAILIGTSSIKQAIVFLIVFQVIQQIEGNVIYPKVVGSKVGLPPVVTIMAIIVGGNLAGFWGMLVCIPLTAILYSLFWTKFKGQKIDEETEEPKKRSRKKPKEA